MLSLNEKLERLQNSNVQVVTSGGSNAISMSIVNSEGNGKRVAFSKELSKKLALTDKIYMVPNEEDGELILSGAQILDISSSGKLSGADKKICYSAALVTMLVETFKLNYDGKTSISFNSISFDEYNSKTVAIVKMETKQ